MYSVEYKRDTIEKYDQLYDGSIRRTARETGIPRKCVQRWVRQRHQIEELVSIEGGDSRRRLKLIPPSDRTLLTHQGMSKKGRWLKDGKFSSNSKQIVCCGLRKRSDKSILNDKESELVTKDIKPPYASKAEPRIMPQGFISEGNSSNLNVVKEELNVGVLEDGETIITVLPSDVIDLSSCYMKEPRLAFSENTCPGSRRNRSSYTLSMKLTALENYYTKYGQNCRKTAREMGIPRKCVQRWVQQRDKIKEWSQVKEHSALKKLFTFRGRKPEYPELERELVSSIQQVRGLGKSITVKELGERAKNLFLQLYPQRDPNIFKASNHWVRNFLKRAQERGDLDDETREYQSGQDALEKVDSKEEHICDFENGCCCGSDDSYFESNDIVPTPKRYLCSSSEDGVEEVGRVQVEVTSDNLTRGDKYIENDDLIPSMISVTRTIPYRWEASNPY